MRPLLAMLLLLAAACGGPSAEPSTTTSAATSTAPRVTVTTQPEQIPLEVQDCTAPQVGFSPLCEAYELIQEWHMDRPIDPNTLATAALSGLETFTTEAIEPVPRTLFCAIPDPAFSPLCQLLAERVSESAIPVGEAIEAALVAMASTGLEQFSYYVPPELVGSYRLNGVVGGIGVLLDARDAAGSKCVRISTTCPLEIVVVLEDNPGAGAGLAPGDQIISVNGETVDGQGFVDTATRIAGDETGSVEIEVVRGGESLHLIITRAPLTIPTVEIDIPRSGIGYLSIPDFEEDISDLVNEGLTQLGDGSIGRLVLDLRDNPGGYVESAIGVASAFIDGDVVLETVGPGQDYEYKAETGGLFTELGIAVLVNAGTASAAEILATALRDQKGAEIIGEPTFGKDAVQIAFDLKNGGRFNVAVARWLSPDGTSVSGTGVLPDRTVHLPTTMSTAELADLAFQQ